MTRLTNKQIAAHFGFTPARAAALIGQGMPVDSLEAATAWREARLLRGQRGGVEQRTAIVVDPSTGLERAAGDADAVESQKVWLLKQKQTQNWKTTKSTADAIYALLLRGENRLQLVIR